MKKIQIGVMGSAADLQYENDAVKCAKELGKLIAESGNILVYGAEKEYSSLSTNAAMSASRNGGITVGVTGGKEKSIYGDFKPSILINSGLEIGGGREFKLVLSCDVIIAISGGSGTLTEMAIAYQAGIPIITISNFGGWAKKIANTFIDDRKRLKCLEATSAKEALDMAIKEATRKIIDYKIINPGGNITALVTERNYTVEERKRINNYILEQNSNVEQVGFISEKENKLEMAGGEFCANATRCAIWKYLKGEPGEIVLNVSGCKNKIKGGITDKKDVFVDLTINKKIDRIIKQEDGFTFVNLDGILFVIADEKKSKKYLKKLKDNEKEAKRELKEIMKTFNTNEKAIGIILIEKIESSIKINPIIWVRDIDTLYYETACGSGSLATTIYMNYFKDITELEILQPSGCFIRVKLDMFDNYIKNAIILGKIIEEE